MRQDFLRPIVAARRELSRVPLHRYFGVQLAPHSDHRCNQKSITRYIYLAGTELPVSVIRDGSVTDVTYDYRQRAISTKVYPYVSKMLESKKVYVDNKWVSQEDPYGRKMYYGYRASDVQLIR